MRKSTDKIKVGITMGDPSGIGPVITLKAIDKLKGLFDFVVIGDKGVLDKTQYSIRNTQYYKLVDLKNINYKSFSFGKIKPEYGRASIQYLDKALELIKNGEIDCIVTCPISKEAINLGGFCYSGHTEYFSDRTNTKNFVMMLLNQEIRISLITRHIPLKKVPVFITEEKIFSTIMLTYNSLRNLFSINYPRIAVCGLNPHASDNGIIGDEENKVIIPALKRLKPKIKYLDGPLSADVAIARTRQKKYDCAVAMYHDQALIPLKLLGDSRGVNITLGLPFIRTSPLHGTAFDLAKTGFNLAKPDSLIAAIKLAAQCAANSVSLRGTK
jgi:4-hydroxythreonine-4-phosphate dehydrogenase